MFFKCVVLLGVCCSAVGVVVLLLAGVVAGVLCVGKYKNVSFFWAFFRKTGERARENRAGCLDKISEQRVVASKNLKKI